MIAVLVASLVMSFVCLGVGVYAITTMINVCNQANAAINMVKAANANLEQKMSELKAALEIVNKLHKDRLTDLEPLYNRLEVLEVKVNAVSSNQRR